MIRSWLKRLFSRPKKYDPKVRHFAWPTKDDIELLPVFSGLTFDDIIEVATGAEAERARKALMAEKAVGFDTESKPTFVKGHVSTGPHVAQFSTLKKAYVFMLHDRDVRRVVADLVSAPQLKKVGFGLSEDVRRIPIKLNVAPVNVLDLETIFAERGFGRGMGVKVAVAITLKRRFIKSKKATTSNWMRRRLSDKQVLYAANDAYAAMKVYHVLGSPR